MQQGEFLTSEQYARLQTLTGLTLDEVAIDLQLHLEADAYRPVSSRDYLTDINPAYLYEALHRCFGMVGIGWGYGYDVDDLVFSNVEWSKTIATQVVIKSFDFWYFAGGGRWHIQSSGGSTNKELEDAMKGAVTNCIGNAASKLLWQLDVRKGKVGHSQPSKDRKQASGKRTPRERKQDAAAGATSQERPSAEGMRWTRQDLDNAVAWAVAHEIIPPPREGQEVAHRRDVRNWLVKSPLQPGFEEHELLAFGRPYRMLRDLGETSADAIKGATDDYPKNLASQLLAMNEEDEDAEAGEGAAESDGSDAGEDGPGSVEDSEADEGEPAEDSPDPDADGTE